MKPKVKICGIRTLNVAQEAILAGADFLGFNFVVDSPRYIQTQKAKEIISIISGRVKTVGVFKNESLDVIRTMTSLLNLDFVQLHGDETEEFCNSITFCGCIKAFSVSPSMSAKMVIRKIKNYPVNYYLLDRFKQGIGEAVAIEVASAVSKEFPIFLAGGLTVQSVSAVVRNVHPFAVDVATAVETDGQSDIAKIRQFIHNAKGNGYES